MPSVKEKMTEVIQAQPDDATYEEIMRELAFEQMIGRGLDDSVRVKPFRERKWDGVSGHGRNEADRTAPKTPAPFGVAQK